MSDTPEVPKPTEGWGSLPAEIREAVSRYAEQAVLKVVDDEINLALDRERIAALLLPLVRDRERMAALAGFAKWVIRESVERQVLDGGDVQEKATALGLLVPVTMTEPCHPENCSCAEVGLPATCYRYTPLLVGSVPGGETV